MHPNELMNVNWADAIAEFCTYTSEVHHIECC